MKKNMSEWVNRTILEPRKRPLPILSFPAIQIMGVTVKELVNDSETQAQAMKLLVERNHPIASVSLMDLSVEAEAFGAEVRFSDFEIPTVIGSVAKNMGDAESLTVPSVGNGRTCIYLDAIKRAVSLIQDIPVLAGVTGPFTLAGQLIGVTETFKAARRNPEMLHLVLEKCTEFITAYALAYQEVGSNGIFMAEPLTGLLSPSMAIEFSEPYVKQIVDRVQSDQYVVIYHNCSGNALRMIDSILRTGAIGYHFGNAISMPDAISKCPPNTLCLGNIDPRTLLIDTADQVRQITRVMLEDCGSAPNYIPSTGCDVPPLAKWDNIDSFYEEIGYFYSEF